MSDREYKVREEELRKFNPLAADHPLVKNQEKKCPGCDEAFKEGDVTTLVVIGPGGDPEERAKAAAGQQYNAVASVVHWACATGEEP